MSRSFTATYSVNPALQSRAAEHLSELDAFRQRECDRLTAMIAAFIAEEALTTAEAHSATEASIAQQEAEASQRTAQIAELRSTIAGLEQASIEQIQVLKLLVDEMRDQQFHREKLVFVDNNWEIRVRPREDTREIEFGLNTERGQIGIHTEHFVGETCVPVLDSLHRRLSEKGLETDISTQTSKATHEQTPYQPTRSRQKGKVKN